MILVINNRQQNTNGFMNIYYFNSISINTLNDNKIKGVIDIVGKEVLKLKKIYCHLFLTEISIIK